MNGTIKVMLVEDHIMVREGTKEWLDRENDIQVVAEAGDGEEAVRLASEHRPDVVIMDIAMPKLNGIEATRQITGEASHTKVVALSMHSGERMVLEMLRAGASGYVLKLSAFDEVERAVRTVMANERYLSPEVAGVLVDELVRQGDNIAPSPSAFSKLSSREREVLQLLAEGKSSKEIAFMLKISARTVDVHRKHIMDKLGLGSIAELTRYALREGLIQE